jgi:hypothetical protein
MDMKRIFGFALMGLMAAAPPVVEAQRAPQGQERAMRTPGQMPLARMMERQAELGLTAEQVARLESIQSRLQQQNAPLVAQVREARMGAERGERGARQVPEEIRPAMQQLRQNNRAAMEEVRAVLSDEQRAKLRETMRRGMRQGTGGQGARAARPGEHGQAMPLARVLEHRAELGLTAEQVGRLESIQARLQQQNAPLLAQLSASGAMRGAGVERGQRERAAARVPEEIRPVMQRIRQNTQTAMQEVRTVLTDEQQVKLRDSMRQGMRERRGDGAARPMQRGQRGAR